MMKFNFTHAGENHDNLVIAFNELVSDFRANKADTKEYKENNAKYTEAMIKYCLEGTGIEFTDVKMVSDPQLSLHNLMFVNKFNTLLAQSITPVVPEVTSQGYDKLYEVFQTGYGDNAKYTVESNEYFIVYDIAEGQTRGNVQTMYDTEYTITARPKQISVAVDWYKIASGIFDFGRFGAKIAKSFEAYIQNAVIKAMTNAISNASNLGIGGYQAVGASKANWISLAQKVSAANGGSDVYALGTLTALGKVIPDDAGFRFMSDDDIVTKGYLPVYNQVPCFELKQAILPTTLNGNPALIVPDNYIYFIPMNFNKPVKVLFEGNNVTVVTDAEKTADYRLGLTITMRIGIDTIVGSKFGVLTVN